MRKIEIVVPKGTKYVSEIKNFELPSGILNKGIPNCGATTLALMDRHKTIVCSPRNNLLVNKHEQYGNSLLVVGGVTESEIKEYVRCAETPKILVSYDSLPKVAGCIEDKSDWRVVADEFQYLLSDSGFKSEVEHRFMVYLKQFEYVTFLSATLILDKYIGQINDFKNMPYYQMKW